LSPHQVKLS